MFRTISPQDMREMERAFMDGTGYPSILLMEHAAQAVVAALQGIVRREAQVLFVCGGGNNGGDGCAVARLWIDQGGSAQVWLLKGPAQMKGDAGANARLLSACGAQVQILYDEAPEIPAGTEAIVDALYGTGLCRAMEGVSLAAVRRVNGSGLPIVAVDIPSGIDGETGHVLGEAVRAHTTVAFHRAKHGHLLFPGRAYVGRLEIAEIGILPDWDDADGYEVLEAQDAAQLLPARPMDGHKGTFGHVLSVAGSEGMAGAACLCAKAALRSGAGLVTAACPYPVLSIIQGNVPCAMARGVSEGEALDASSAVMLEKLAKDKDALAIGPGLGQRKWTFEAIQALMESDLPKVIDADALNLIAAYKGSVGTNTVMTPHPGEMARLLGVTTREVLEAPVDAARQLAQMYHACVLLKGATTVIAMGEDVALDVSGCDGMATGGCGDVLTGVIAGLLAQGMPPMDAARVGALMHGRAGEAAQRQLGARAVTAMDVLENLRIE